MDWKISVASDTLDAQVIACSSHQGGDPEILRQVGL